MYFKNKISISIIGGLLISFICVCVFFCVKKSYSSVIYIDNTRVFNEFKMTKELIKEGKQVLQDENKKLMVLYESLKNSANESEKKDLTQQIFQQKQSIDDFKNSYTVKNSEKIWKRINHYLEDFSKSYHYDFIIGVDLMGNAFYGKPDLDKTTEILTYINKRYEGYN